MQAKSSPIRAQSSRTSSRWQVARVSCTSICPVEILPPGAWPSGAEPTWIHAVSGHAGRQAARRTARGRHGLGGRGEGLQPQMTPAYSEMVRSVENLAMDDAAWMLSLHHLAWSA